MAEKTASSGEKGGKENPAGELDVGRQGASRAADAKATPYENYEPEAAGRARPCVCLTTLPLPLSHHPAPAPVSLPCPCLCLTTLLEEELAELPLSGAIHHLLLAKVPVAG